jgi:UDP-N-acetylmuramoylalanine--D-glutamate ligase
LVVDDRRLLAVSDLRRALNHDRANALAAALMVEPLGVGDDDVAAALSAFDGLPHRVQFVGESGGVAWYDDSKATTPHATRAAVDGFESVVLVAGGRNKGLDLSELLGTRGTVRAVVAIGEAAPAVVDAVAGRVPVATAPSMTEAVAEADALARPGDTVVLSPGCASFDWYSSYGERGDDFARLVRIHLDREASHP